MYNFSWDISTFQNKNFRVDLLNWVEINFGFCMQHCYSVAFDFLWMAEKSDYPFRFLLSREQSLLFSLRGFFQLSNSHSVNYTIWIDCWWIKRQGTFFQRPKVFVWKTFVSVLLLRGVWGARFICRQFWSAWKVHFNQFGELPHSIFHLSKKSITWFPKSISCICFEIHILFYCFNIP